MAHGDDPHSTAYGTSDGDSRKSQSRPNPTAGTCLYHVVLDSSPRIIGTAKPISISAAKPARSPGLEEELPVSKDWVWRYCRMNAARRRMVRLYSRFTLTVCLYSSTS